MNVRQERESVCCKKVWVRSFSVEKRLVKPRGIYREINIIIIIIRVQKLKNFDFACGR